MTLRDVKKLKVGDKFRRPSTNGHDNGWREYTIAYIFKYEDDSGFLIRTIDQHGFVRSQSITYENWSHGFLKQWFKTAEVMK